MTNSRDTQELLPEAGQEMLRIFHTHPARTSLLQDFAFYEVCLLWLDSDQMTDSCAQLQAMQKEQQRRVHSGTSSPDQNSSVQSSNMTSPVLGANTAAQHPFAMSNPAALAYAAQMGLTGMNMGMGMGMGMNPMLQMQMNMGGMGSAFANPHTLQSVMRNPSPAPMGGQNYMGMGGMPGF